MLFLGCTSTFTRAVQENEAEGVDIAKYVTGAETAPLPTYFLGGEDRDGLLGVMGVYQPFFPPSHVSPCSH